MAKAVALDDSDDRSELLDVNGNVPASGLAERTLRLCDLLAEEGRPLSLSDITSKLALPKGSVHRLCAHLVSLGYLARDVDERMFIAGPALRKLALNVLNHGTLRGMRHDVLAELVEQIGETCNFTTLDGTDVLYLDRVEAPRPFRLTVDVGTHVPLHCTSSGKLLLANLPKRKRDAVIRKIQMPRLTDSTITSPQMLKAECEEILSCGFARDREEFVAGLISVAVPVRDLSGNVRATISVHAPVARMTMKEAEGRIPLLEAASAKMGQLI